MSTIPEIATALRHVLATKADELARLNRFVRRSDKPLTGARFVQTVIFTLLAKPRPAITDYCHSAAALGLPISEQGFDQNFTEQAADLLLQVLQLLAAVVVCAADPLAAGLLARFSAVLICDSTCIALPPALAKLWTGCGNGSRPQSGTSATLKVALGVDLVRGSFSNFELLAGAVHDRLSKVQQQDLPAQGLRLADLGFFKLERFAAIAAQNAYWFSRLQSGVVVFTGDGKRWELEDLLASQKGNHYDQWVELGVSAHLPARLIAVRVKQEVADKRRAQLRAAAKRKAAPVSKRRLASADWNVYVSNIAVEQLSAAEAMVLAGVRWQIELLFKVWKSQGKLAQWADSGNKWRIMSEVYGKLCAMVLSHWLLVVSCWANPARSMVGAAAVVRQYGTAIVSSWAKDEQLISALELVGRVISLSCQLTKRKKQPSTYQLLLNPALLANRGILA